MAYEYHGERNFQHRGRRVVCRLECDFVLRMSSLLEETSYCLLRPKNRHAQATHHLQRTGHNNIQTWHWVCVYPPQRKQLCYVPSFYFILTALLNIFELSTNNQVGLFPGNFRGGRWLRVLPSPDPGGGPVAANSPPARREQHLLVVLSLSTSQPE